MRPGSPAVVVASGWLLLGAAAAVDAEDQHTRVEKVGSVLQVTATLEAAVAATTCFAVLADFDRLAEFVPDMLSSQVVSAPGDPVRLRQVGLAEAGPFHFTMDVTLAVTSIPPHRIEFARVAGNVERMQGSWTVTGDDRYCSVAYEAEIKPGFWVPPFVGPTLMRQQVDEQMAGLLREIRRRGSPGMARDQ